MLWGLVLSAGIGAIFALVSFFARHGPIVFSISMLTISGLIAGFMLYVTFAGRNMSYELGDSEFKVNFGPMKLSAPYSAINRVQLSPVKLLLRIFGGSWPGLHWGIFQADIGRVHAYSTRRSGNFILVSLGDGRKIAISPEEPKEFLEEMSAKIDRIPESSATDVKLYETSSKTVCAQVLMVIIAYMLLVAYVLSIYPSLPEVIPVHFDFSWNPNRWAHKTELFTITGIGATFPTINTILAVKFGKYGKETLFFFGAIFISAIVLFTGTIQSIVELSFSLVG